MFLVVFLYALLAGTFSLGKMILAYSQPIFVVGMRMSIAGALLLAYHLMKNPITIKIKKEHLWLFIQATIFTIYIPYQLRYWGLVYLSPSKACLLYNFGPFLTYFFSYLCNKEQFTLKKIAGLLLGFFGLLPLIVKSSVHTPINHGLYILPELALLGAVTCMSYGWIIIHKLINHEHYAPSMTNGVTMFAGGLLALCTSYFLEDHSLYILDPIPFTAILITIVIVSNLICHNLYGSLLRVYSPTMLSLMSFLSPIFASLYGWLFLHEHISLHFFVCVFVIFIGLMLFYSEELSGKQTLTTA